MSSCSISSCIGDFSFDFEDLFFYADYFFAGFFLGLDLDLDFFACFGAFDYVFLSFD